MYEQDFFHLPHHHADLSNAEVLHQELTEKAGEFRTVSEVFSLLGDPTRIRIFWLLCHCEACVINIAAIMEMSSPAVSHHLRSLRATGLIISRREGKEVFYRAADSETALLLHHMIERVMRIACPEERQIPAEYRDDQIEVIRDVHDYLIAHLSERVTIDELSRRFHMNQTTLKAVFKAVYGSSLAAHVKEHRMELAAQLLQTTDLSVLDVAKQAGYDSQSKFSAAFKACYGALPTEYRKLPPQEAVK